MGNTPIRIDGIPLDGSTTVSLMKTLPNPKTPLWIKEDELENFTNLTTLVISTLRNGDIVVMDDIKLGFVEECNIVMPSPPQSSSLSSSSSEIENRNLRSTFSSSSSSSSFSFRKDEVGTHNLPPIYARPTEFVE